MKFITNYYNKPGPGVDPNEPRKKGIKRFFEILGREFGGFIILSLYYFLLFSLSLILFICADFGILPEYAFIISLVAAIPMGTACCTLVYCISKMLRDDPEYIWYDIKKKSAEYFKQSIIPGVLYTAFIYGQVFFWRRFAYGGGELNIGLFVFEALSLVIIGMVAPYIFLQIAYVDLKLPQIAKNSFILAFANLPRSIMGALTGNLLWFLFWNMLPASLLAVPLMVLFAFSISWLLCLMWVWPPVDKQFNIENTIRERYDKQLEEKMDDNKDSK